MVIAGLVSAFPLLTACESTHLYADSRLAATSTTSGVPEVLSWACSSDRIQRLYATNGSEEIWSATPTDHESGLDSVRADGQRQPGWEVSGKIDASSQEEVFLYVNLAGQEDQTIAVVPSTLKPGELAVAAHAYGGTSTATQEDFIRTNERWCT
jgi:hypothetical protein